MKLHRPLCEAVVTILGLIFHDKKYADKVIEKTLKQNPRWGSRDRRFVAEAVYEVVRWQRLLKEASHAEDGDFWKPLGALFIWQGTEVPHWKEIDGMEKVNVADRIAELKNERKIGESIPNWLDELGEQELGSRWGDELRALNQQAPLALRVNTLKCTTRQLQKALSEDDVETETTKNFRDALVVKKRQNVFQLQAFKDGFFEVQDAASQLIAPFLKAEPGMRIIDACAGGGGKTLHIAALMENKGKIIAMDTEEWKLEELKKRAWRAGATNIETMLITSSKVIKRLHGSADRLLLDVPCSGLGVLKRNPDYKWKLSPEFIDKVKVLQRKILSDYSPMVKPEGLMVYSTCSILPSENEDQVKFFLSEQPGFQLIEEKNIWPSQGFDGFYMALIRRSS